MLEIALCSAVGITPGMPVAESHQGSCPIRARVREQRVGTAGSRLKRQGRHRGFSCGAPAVLSFAITLMRTGEMNATGSTIPVLLLSHTR